MKSIKKFNIIFFLLVFLVAFAILLVSLQSANRQRSTGSEHSSLVSGKFYVAREILPDHTLYPVLMVIDRLRLELVEPEQHSSLLVSYAKRRLFYSKRLLEKEQRELAFVTLSKAINYYHDAVEVSRKNFDEQLLSERVSQELAFMVIDSLADLFSFLETHKDKFSDEEKVLLDLHVEQLNHALSELEFRISS